MAKARNGCEEARFVGCFLRWHGGVKDCEVDIVVDVDAACDGGGFEPLV